MDRFDAMRVFTRVVERRSFSLAADDLGLPRSTVTDAVKTLEARLGVRLLERTTRQVRPTLDGEAHYRRCLSLIADLEDAEGAFGGARPKGMLRLEVQGTLARHFLLPNLPGFFAQYPDIEINMSESDRWIDLIREGVDCVLRFGHLPDSDMIARQVVVLERLTCAAPACPAPRVAAVPSASRRRTRLPHLLDRISATGSAGNAPRRPASDGPAAWCAPAAARRGALPAS